MRTLTLPFYKALFEELDPARLQSLFLQTLLKIQNVERGSVWIRQGDRFVCVEAAGLQSDAVRGRVLSSEHPSVVRWVFEHAQQTIVEAGHDGRHFQEVEQLLDVKSRLILGFPLVLADGSVYGVVELIDTSAGGERLNLDSDYLELLHSVVDIGAIALSHALSFSEQAAENRRLRRQLEGARASTSIVGRSPAFQQALRSADNFSRADFPVLITGESGTGKELVAREIHRLSPRRDKPFSAQNCSAIPENLLESELFGYLKGAFTGASRDRKGLFEAADGGTVFLDEIGDMPVKLQARILRVLQEGEVKPLGSPQSREVDVRIISATHQDLGEGVRSRTFREDLFYRLNVLPLRLPPLRERRDDIPELLRYFSRREAVRMGIPPKTFGDDALAVLVAAPWPGNVRELENVVKYVLATVPGERVGPADLPPHLTTGEPLPRPAAAPGEITSAPPTSAERRPLADHSWEEMERAYVTELLHVWSDNVSQAARAAGLKRSTFDSRLKRLGVR